MDDPVRMPADALAPADEDTDELLWRMAVAEQVAGMGPMVDHDDHAEVRDGGGQVVATVPVEPERVPWTIESDDDAEWALARLAETEAGLAAVLAHVESQQAKAEEWADRVLNQRRRGPDNRVLPSLLESRRILTAHLEWYARRQREEKDRATVDLIAGAVKTRKAKPTVVITDPDALVKWARDNVPEVVRVREDVLVSDLRKYVKVTDDEKLLLTDPGAEGEGHRPDVVLDEIPGVAVEPEGLTVTVAPTPLALER